MTSCPTTKQKPTTMFKTATTEKATRSESR